RAIRDEDDLALDPRGGEQASKFGEPPADAGFLVVGGKDNADRGSEPRRAARRPLAHPGDAGEDERITKLGVGQGAGTEPETDFKGVHRGCIATSHRARQSAEFPRRWRRCSWRGSDPDIVSRGFALLI